MNAVLFGTLVGVAPRAGRIVAQAPEALSKVYRRAEFWDPEQATLGDIVSVVGRWARRGVAGASRNSVENQRDGPMAATKERYEMAQRMGCVERIAMRQNVRTLRFVGEARRGLRHDLRRFPGDAGEPRGDQRRGDALAEQVGLIPPAVVNQRRSEWLTRAAWTRAGAGPVQEPLARDRVVVLPRQGPGPFCRRAEDHRRHDLWEKYSLPPGTVSSSSPASLRRGGRRAPRWTRRRLKSTRDLQNPTSE